MVNLLPIVIPIYFKRIFLYEGSRIRARKIEAAGNVWNVKVRQNQVDFLIQQYRVYTTN